MKPSVDDICCPVPLILIICMNHLLGSYKTFENIYEVTSGVRNGLMKGKSEEKSRDTVPLTLCKEGHVSHLMVEGEETLHRKATCVYRKAYSGSKGEGLGENLGVGRGVRGGGGSGGGSGFLRTLWFAREVSRKRTKDEVSLPFAGK